MIIIVSSLFVFCKIFFLRLSIGIKIAFKPLITRALTRRIDSLRKLNSRVLILKYQPTVRDTVIRDSGRDHLQLGNNSTDNA